MSPLEIMVLLHHYFAAERWPRPSPAYSDALARFLNCGLIEPNPENPSGYDCTPRGVAFVKALQATPLPVREAKWVVKPPVTEVTE